jgi:hypothetical protein
METVRFVAVIWVGLALIATLPGIWLKLSTALSEVVVGTVAQLVIGHRSPSSVRVLRSSVISQKEARGHQEHRQRDRDE